MSQPALFHQTPSWQLALLAAAGIAGSGFMAFQAGQPIAQLLSKPGSLASNLQPANLQPGQIAGSNSINQPADTVTSLKSQVANLVARVAELEDSTKSDVVLGDSTESAPSREEFPPAVNLIRNSSFEENSDGAPRQWNYNQWSSSGNTFTTAEAIRTGSAGLKVLGSSTTNFGFSQPTTKMVEGRNYALSIWVKPVNTDSHTVKLSFWDELNNKEASAKSFSFTGTKEWSRLVLQISNKNTWNGKKWYPMVTVNGLNQGAVYFDDAQLEEASSYTPYHFEGGGATQSHVSVLGDGSVEIDAHGNVYPAVNGIGGLGTGDNKFAELKLSKATIDKNGSLTLEGDITVDGNGTFKGAMNFSGTIKSHLIPDQDSTYDLGSTAKNWRVGYIDQLNLENRETINNNIDSDITFIENNTGGNNTLVFDLNAAADAVELRNDTEDLRLRAAGNANLVLRAGDAATNSNVDGNDLFLASEDAMTLRSATYSLQTSGSTITMTALNSSITLSTGSDTQGFMNLRSAGTLTLDTTLNRSNINVLSGGTSSSSLTLRSVNGGIDISTGAASGAGNLTLRSAGTLLLDTSALGTDLTARSGTGLLTLTSARNNAQAILAEATAGGIDILASAASAGEDIDISATGSSVNLQSTENVDDAITLWTTNGGIDISTSGVGGLGALVLRSGGSLKIDTSGNNNNILVDSGTGDLLENVGTNTMSAVDDAINAISLSATRGGINLSSSSASGSGDIKLRSAGTLHLDTSANNTNILANTGQGRLVATSNNAGITAIQVLATNGGIDISTSGVGGLGELRLRSGGSLKLDTSGNNNNVLLDSGTGDLLANIGTGTFTAVDDAVAALGLNATRGGITLSSSNASGNGNIKLLSGGTLQLSTSGNNSSVLLQAGTGAFTVNAGASTHTYTGAYAVTDTAQISLTSNQAAINSIALAATNGGIDISTSGVGGLGELRLRSGGSLKIDTSGNNNNVLLDSGTGDLLANVGTTTLSAVDDAINAISLSATRGGINLSSSSASGSGDIKLRSAGTLYLDTSANNTNILANTGQGRLVATSNNAGITAIQLLATNGGIDISTSGLGGLGELRLRSGGSLKIDTSGNNNNVLVTAGTGTVSIASGATNIGDGGTTNYAAFNATGDLTFNGTANNIVGANDLVIRSGGSLTLDTSANNTSLLVRSGQGQTSVTSNQAAITAIALAATNGGIDISTSGLGGLGELRLRSGGSLKIDTSGNNNNVLVDTGTGDLLENVGTNTLSAVDDAINAISLSATRGGINLSSSSASGSGDIKLRSAGTLHLDTSANNTNILANTGQGRLVATSNNAGITAIQLLATNGGIDISTSGLGGLGELRLRSGGSLKIDTSGNNNNVLVTAGTGTVSIASGATNIGDGGTTNYAAFNSTGDLTFNGTANNIVGANDLVIRSGGSLTLDTSANNTSLLVRSGQGQTSITSNQAAITAIQLLATNGGIDISTSGLGGLGELRLRSGGSLKLDTSGNNNNILVDSGTGDLLANVGTTTLSAVDDAINAISLSATRGGINLSSSSASGSGDIKLRSAGTLHLDTSANGTNILANTGQGRLVATSNNAGITAIQLLATNGGVDISTSGLGGLGELRLRAGGSLKLDTSGNNNNILVDSGTGDLLANVGTTTLSAVDDAINAISLSATRGGINLSSSSASGSGDIKLRSAGTLHLDTSANGTNILANTGTGRLIASSGGTGVGASAAISLLATNGGIDLSTSGAAGNGDLRLRSAGTLQLDTSASDTNILVIAGGDTVNSLALRSDRGGIDLSSSSASGAGDVKIRSAGTLHLDTSANNTNILANTGQGRLVATSNNAGITAIQLLATNGGIDISTSGLGGVGELRLRAGGSLKLDTSGNNNNILVDSGTGDLLANVGTTTLSAVDDAINAISLSATRGGINLSSSNASGSGDIKIRSAGTLHLDTSAAGSSILANTGTGRLIASSGGTGVGASAAISLLATNGGIDLSTSGAAGNGDLRLRSAGTLQLDTSASDTNILVIAGGDTVNSLALRSDRGGIDISTSAASGAGSIVVRSAGTLQLDTSAANSTLLVRTGTGTVDVSSGVVHIRSANENLNAIRLLADRGGINISSGNAAGNGNITIKSAGTLQLDTSANNSNIMVRAGTGRIDLSGNTILINSGAGTLDLSSNSTIKIVSSTTASLWGETGTELGRAGQLTTVYGRMCIKGSDGGTACPAGSDGRLFVQVTGEAGADDPGDVFDLAEYYPASEAVDPGTVVVADSSTRATVKKSNYPYQRVLGVVSTSPAIRINEGSFEVGGTAITAASVKPLIALVGRVPVKVTNENGPVKVGDRLVASSTAGSAMKAVKQGMTLGMVLEDADFKDAAEAKVMTFVNVSWYFPEVVDALEKEHQMAQALGVAPDVAGATADALVAAQESDPSLPAEASAEAGSPAVLGLATPSLTLAIPPTEFPNITVADTLTVGKSLIVNGTAKFEGTVEVLSDATFAKSVIIVGNLRIGGNLEIAGAVVTSFTAGSSLSAGDPVSVNSSGQAVKAGGSNAVVGVAASNAAAGDKVSVAVAGKVGGLSGLSAGARYYVSESGALTTDGKGGQAVGVAVSSTELLVQPGVGLPAEASAEAGLPAENSLNPLNSLTSPEPAAVEPTPTPTGTPISPITPTPTAVPTAVPAEPTPTPTP